MIRWAGDETGKRGKRKTNQRNEKKIMKLGYEDER